MKTLRAVRLFFILLLCVAVSECSPKLPGKPTNHHPRRSVGSRWSPPTKFPASGRRTEAALGTKIVIVNQPGASGSVGTKYVLDQKHVGYTWAAGAAADLATYPVLGFLDTDIRKDWHIYLSVATSW